MSGAKVFVFINGPAIRVQFEPTRGGFVSMDLSAGEAHWLGSALLARTDGDTVREPEATA